MPKFDDNENQLLMCSFEMIYLATNRISITDVECSEFDTWFHVSGKRAPAIRPSTEFDQDRPRYYERGIVAAFCPDLSQPFDMLTVKIRRRTWFGFETSGWLTYAGNAAERELLPGPAFDSASAARAHLEYLCRKLRA